MAIKSLSIRIDEELLHKLHIVADYEGRSANSQILILIRNAVADYEAKTEKSNGSDSGKYTFNKAAKPPNGRLCCFRISENQSLV